MTLTSQSRGGYIHYKCSDWLCSQYKNNSIGVWYSTRKKLNLN